MVQYASLASADDYRPVWKVLADLNGLALVIVVSGVSVAMTIEGVARALCRR